MNLIKGAPSTACCWAKTMCVRACAGADVCLFVPRTGLSGCAPVWFKAVRFSGRCWSQIWISTAGAVITHCLCVYVCVCVRGALGHSGLVCYPPNQFLMMLMLISHCMDFSLAGWTEIITAHRPPWSIPVRRSESTFEAPWTPKF